MERNADTPERNTNVGAHKWVIHRVKNSIAVVVLRSVGFRMMAVVCMISLTWSRAMMTITMPLIKSML